MEDLKNKNTENHENASSNTTENLNESANMADQTNVPEELTDELESVQSELAEQKEKYLRLYAEFDNYKRRNARERVELIQTAGKEVIISLLDVMDDCDRAEKQVQESGQPEDAVQEGILLIFNKLRSILSSKGLKPMDCKGQEFNPDEHEAVSQVPVADEKLKGKIIEEIVKGYYLNDKIIRFAKVVVGL
ncbi:nucleotide exchange factor GrpE [Agriterribacter sp.]|uniref:nucleotide exchange factor GrpE n=1 Tax=Agriterribacter sp. TaxID=2821509 RepID=UPI002C71DCEC|nr:nucleotide exchange factor GrpE [Agriterribacter sp.]HRO48455.1 nucleotide exchange factor GrpE [Agriterribacter sp.]HRQ19574.1 nucleotide exchange factor GrpE [Agriterribacter sp.]